MPRDNTTSYYEVKVTFDITEKNQYGDTLSARDLSYTVKSKAKSLKELAEILTIVDEALN